MSGYLAGKVWRSGLSGTLKPLAACLADFANDDGSGVYPSVGYLTWLLDSGESTVRRQMSELRSLAILIPVANEAGGRGRIPVYRLDEEALPVRPPYRKEKALNSDTLYEKGLNSDSKRVSKTKQKGLKNDRCNKEEPSVEPSVLTLAPPSSEPVKVEKKKVDERHTPFRTSLEKFWVYQNPDEPAPNWSVKDAGQLGKFLKDWPTIDHKTFRQWLKNYDESENINTSLRPYQILPRLHEYSQGPLNQYHKPLEEKRASA